MMRGIVLSRISKFREKLKQRKKFEVLKSIIQAATVTVVAVVAVVVITPKSPKASFDEVKAFSSELIYQVTVTDEDLVVENDELTIVLKNQLEEYVKTITIGENIGSFTNLNKNTQYDLQVIYDKGFGKEVLAEEKVVTSDELVAAISSVQPSEITSPHGTVYDLELIYGETDGYSDFQIKYATVYDYDSEIIYNYYYLSQGEDAFTLSFFGSGGDSFLIILEATYESQIVEIDRVELEPPFELYAFLYLSSYSDIEASLSIYIEQPLNIEISYWLEVYRSEQLVQKIDYLYSEEQHHGSLVEINNLKSDSAYRILFKAEYDDPITLRPKEVVITEVEFQTLPIINFTYTIEEQIDYYSVIIESETDLVDLAYYEIYYDDNGFWMYDSMFTFSYQVIENKYIYEFQVPKKTYDAYYINIGLMSSVDSQQNKLIIKIDQ
jgi:hypothetical protein